jgi:hypothetical protein
MKFFIQLLILTFFCHLSFAQEFQGEFQDWSIFKVERGGKNICYVASLPIKFDGNYGKRGEPFFLVTNIENDADEISVASGFIFKKSSNVEVSFSKRKFYLFPHEATAWANNKNEDIDIIKEMQKHEDVVVTAVGRDGKVATDTYSLVGFIPAYKKMKQICQDLR